MFLQLIIITGVSIIFDQIVHYILHFFVSMCIEAGMTADDLYRVYVGKNHENRLRQEGLSQKPGYEAHPRA